MATDAIGGLSSAAAGAVIARAFADAGAQVAVIPMGEAGVGFVDACAALWGASTTDAAGAVVAVSGDLMAVAPHGPGQPAVGFDPDASSRQLASGWVGSAPGRTVYLDLAGNAAHDGGAGLLAGLGASASVPLDEGVAALRGMERLDLRPAFEALGGARLVGVVPVDERDTPLHGLRGITSRRGRETGMDPAQMLAVDAALANLAAEATLASGSAAPLSESPNAGACGGAALAVLALGGTIVTGPDALAQLSGLPQTLARAELVVTGYSQLDFGTSGGPVLRRVAELAAEHTSPVVAVAGRNHISARELRSLGIEQAYAIAPELDPESLDADVIARGLAPVVRQWAW